MPNKDIFQAIADPTRRQIIHIIAKESMNLNAIAEKFDISRPAVSKHIKILSACGVIEIIQRGRERHCRANLQSFEPVSTWMAECRAFWTGKLDALEIFLDAQTVSNRKHRKRKEKRERKKAHQKSKKNKKS
jgi:DNA-binding transcriptional ArsR family regulator